MNFLDSSSNEVLAFNKLVGGRNWLTPSILGYTRIKYGVAEVSTGPKFMNVEMFGITVVRHGVRNFELSKCLNSMQDVENYIEELNK